MKIALVHLKVKDFDYSYNLNQIQRSYESSVDCGASIVVFPELTLTGYFMVTDSSYHTPEIHIDNQYYLSRVYELVQHFKVPLCIGAFLNNECVYLFVDSTGYKTIRKRKAHLVDSDKSGDFFEFGDKTFATLICDETMSIETVNNTLMCKPDILLHPSAYGEPLPYVNFPIKYNQIYKETFDDMLVLTTNITDSYMHENKQTFGRTSIMRGNMPLFDIASSSSAVVLFNTETNQTMSGNLDEN